MRAIETRFHGADEYELFTGHKSERNLALYRHLGYAEDRAEAFGHHLTLQTR